MCIRDRDYSAISNYPCVLSDEATDEKIPERFDLSEYDHLFDDDEKPIPVTE